MKWSEGRVSLFGHHSKAGKRRLERRQEPVSHHRTNRNSQGTDVDEEVPKGSPGLDLGKRVTSEGDALHVVEREIEVDSQESSRR